MNPLFDRNVKLDLHPEEAKMIDHGKKIVKIRLFLAIAISLIILAWLFFILVDNTGTIVVNSNITGAAIFLDAAPTEYMTNTRMQNIPLGEHIFSVELEGYRVVGPYTQKTKISSGSIDTLHFILEKIPVPDEPELNSKFKIQNKFKTKNITALSKTALIFVIPACPESSSPLVHY